MTSGYELVRVPLSSSSFAALILEAMKVLPPVSGWFAISILRWRSRMRVGSADSLQARGRSMQVKRRMQR